MKLRTLSILIAIGVSGCVTATPISPLSSESKSEVVREKNYELGVALSAVVGAPIVRVKDYRVTTLVGQTGSVHAVSAADIRGGIFRMQIAAGEELPIIGQTNHDGVSYVVAKKGRFGVQVSPTGEIYHKVLNAVDGDSVGIQPIEMIYDFVISPPGTRLQVVASTKTEVDKTGYKENYEMLFNGIDGQAIHIQYREYSVDNLARPAFYQELSYPVSAKVLRFRNLEVQVTSVDAERIVYAVTKD